MDVRTKLYEAKTLPELREGVDELLLRAKTGGTATRKRKRSDETKEGTTEIGSAGSKKGE